MSSSALAAVIAAMPGPPQVAAAAQVTGDKPAKPKVRVAPPDASCACCGTSIPFDETECAFCRLEKLPRVGRKALLLHWLVFLVAMGIVFCGGYLLGP